MYFSHSPIVQGFCQTTASFVSRFFFASCLHHTFANLLQVNLNLTLILTEKHCIGWDNQFMVEMDITAVNRHLAMFLMALVVYRLYAVFVIGAMVFPLRRVSKMRVRV
jgi:hypothetical protein